LNKYYPPDFDPSKIPRFKSKDGKGRNATFVIRLMAPCNMRCTTCGEYIYKGRKFNARKEDVDDMNHLGLRIFRFYIKCTACLSEISFRTDPANTDYVLEAGATRNFEALAKAEKQAELEQKAYQDELATNPMKLLEERTEQSKKEMDQMEALEELQEMNKREARINYDGMLDKYDKIREKEKMDEEAQDEQFIKDVFEARKVKRLVDADSSDSSEDGDLPKKKVAKTGMFSKKTPGGAAVTDVLTSGGTPGASLKPTPSWAKSVGGLGVKKSTSLKNSLGVVAVKKKGLVDAGSSSEEEEDQSKEPAKSGVFSKPKPPAAPAAAAIGTAAVQKATPAWAKSVGGLGVKKSTSLKNSLGVIVKKKT